MKVKILNERMESLLNEGLESQIDALLDKYAPHIRDLYFWDDGLVPEEQKDGPMIAATINRYGSGEIGKASFNEFTGKVHFNDLKRSGL